MNPTHLAEAEGRFAVRSSIPANLVAATGPLQPGDRLVGRYLIERELGEFAYAARDEQTGGRRVVKAMCGYFRSELDALAQLDHPGLAAVLDSGELPGGSFLVTEFVSGETLRAAVEQGPFYPARAIKLIRQLGAAIDFAHPVSICFDLKPDNIVLRDVNTPAERAVIVDFGLAAAPLPWLPAGTQRYRSPERRTGSGVHSSGLYTLGVIALELLTGSALLPYALARAPEAVRAVLARATAQGPEDRFSSASEFAEALAASLRTPRTCPWIGIALAALILGAFVAGLC